MSTNVVPSRRPDERPLLLRLRVGPAPEAAHRRCSGRRASVCDGGRNDSRSVAPQSNISILPAARAAAALAAGERRQLVERRRHHRLLAPGAERVALVDEAGRRRARFAPVAPTAATLPRIEIDTPAAAGSVHARTEQLQAVDLEARRRCRGKTNTRPGPPAPGAPTQTSRSSAAIAAPNRSVRPPAGAARRVSLLPGEVARRRLAGWVACAGRRADRRRAPRPRPACVTRRNM